VCAVLTTPRQVGGIAVNECTGCSGLWVPGESFDVLVSRAIDARRKADPADVARLAPRVRGANPAAQRVQYRKCPECDAFMARRNFRKSSGVILDVCHEHGTWLDADELEQIAGFILSGGSPSPILRAEEPDAAGRRAAAAFARIRTRHAVLEPSRPDGPTAGSILDVLTRLFT
jgi:Zn-finger nucleic acid-binding protein